MIDRRTFIQRAALFAITPAVAAPLPLLSTARTPLTSGAGKYEDSVRFKIDGWDHRDAKIPTGNEALIRINQSWRTAWR